MASIFTSGVRGVSHIMSTSNAIYIVADQPLANQVLTATSSTTTAYITHSYLINTIGTISDVPDPDTLDISGTSIVPHKASATTAGPVIGGGWNASSMNRPNIYNNESTTGTLNLGLGTNTLQNVDTLFTQNTSSPCNTLTIVGYNAGRNISDVVVSGNNGINSVCFGSQACRSYGYPVRSVMIGSSTPLNTPTLISTPNIIGNNCANTSGQMKANIFGHNNFNALLTSSLQDVGGLIIGHGNARNVTAISAGIPFRNYQSTLVGHNIDGSVNVYQSVIIADNFVIPSNTSNTCYFNVDRVPVTATGVALSMNTSGDMARAVSSEKYKTSLGNYDGSSNFIYDLSGVCYYFNADLNQRERVGYIAEGLTALSASDYIIYSRIYDIDSSGNYIYDSSSNKTYTKSIESIDYKALIVPIVEEMKKLNEMKLLINTSLTTLGII